MAGFIVFNVLLYILFVVLIILFSVLPEQVTESSCPSQVADEEGLSFDVLESFFTYS